MSRKHELSFSLSQEAGSLSPKSSRSGTARVDFYGLQRNGKRPKTLMFHLLVLWQQPGAGVFSTLGR